LGYQATPATNFNVKALVNYQSDPLVLHDFFENDYNYNPQPNTFVEADKYWDNWDLDALTTPRVNNFFSQVERLPDVKLTGLRQQIFNTPFYYDSESSAGWYQSFTANETNGFYAATNGYIADSAARVDTFHQVTLPWTFFNWLNVEPRIGGRFTYYSTRSMTSGLNEDAYRAVLNTGVRTSFKASQLWVGATNSFLQVDGLRHIIEPSINYVFVPDPSVPPSQLPQFDSQLPSLMLLPILFPDYNDIDSIDTMNVVRFGLRNTLQTKRNGQIDNLVDWNLLLDWRLDPKPGQNNLDDLYSQLRFKPRTWLTLDSQIRFDIQHARLNLALHQLTFAPNDRWSWGIGHWYLNNDAANSFLLGQNNFITSTFFYRVNENWAFSTTHNFNVLNGRLQQQFYTVYRDLRSMTAALTFRVVDDVNHNPDFTIAVSLSLKASPRTRVGEDVANPYRLVGE
jgi:LPS-assembly protein